MAVKRALLFRAGQVGLICAAFEVAIERGSEDRKGTMRGIGECTKPATVVVVLNETETAFCTDCGTAIARSSDVNVVERVERG